MFFKGEKGLFITKNLENVVRKHMERMLENEETKKLVEGLPEQQVFNMMLSDYLAKFGYRMWSE